MTALLLWLLVPPGCLIFVLVVYRLNLHVTERLLSPLLAVSRQQSIFWMPLSKCKRLYPSGLCISNVFIVSLQHSSGQCNRSGKRYKVHSGQYFDSLLIWSLKVLEDTFKSEMRNTSSGYTLKCVVAYCWQDWNLVSQHRFSSLLSFSVLVASFLGKRDEI